MKRLKIIAAVLLLAIVGSLSFLYSGLINIGADDYHSRPLYWALETLRERSIAVRSGDIQVPALDDPELLLAGGADYNEMCSGCHLKPGRTASEISAGLYPQPPNLALGADGHSGHERGHGEVNTDPARQFWIIKHGIKASGMAAFGPTHDDARIWAMVAFLQKLPTLDAEQYQILTARGEGEMADMDHGDGHSHGAESPTTAEAAADPHAGMSMPGMEMPAALPVASTALAAVEAFQIALKSGDAAAVQHWLVPEVLIYEGGGAERSRDEYAGHHLGADMAFMKDARIDVLKRSSGGDADTAWVTTESRIRGKSSKGKPLDVASTETALLRKTSAGWRIVHLHWSSQDFKPKA